MTTVTAVPDLTMMLRRAGRREPMASVDSLSGAHFERVEIDGERFVLKHLDRADDWVARASGDVALRPLVAWESGLLARLPAEIDHAIVAYARGSLPGTGALLLRDVGPWLVPAGDAPLPLAQHRRFLDHMAALHAAFWGFRDDLGLLPLSTHLLALSPWVAAAESGTGAAIPALLDAGWAQLDAQVPAAAALARAVVADPAPLAAALAATPATLIHGDWKAGNLAALPDGRTVLLDWARVGEGPACVDLAWYLAVNCDRLPESKDAAIAAYRAALERRGVTTIGWFDRQLQLSLLAAFVLLGWSKSGAELAWWAQRVRPPS